MTSSAARLLAASALVAVLGAGTALAQGPIRLTPPRPAPPPTTETKPVEEAKPAPPVSGSPTVLPPAGPVGPAAPASATPPQGIQVDTLQSVDADAVGAIGTAEGALPTTLWQGTPRLVAERLVGLLPNLPDSRVMRGLARRLLLSPALLPEGTPAEPRLLILRAEKLIAMGELAGVEALLKVVPQRIADARIDKLRLDAAHLRFDTAGACNEIRRELGRSRNEASQRGQAFCLAIAGDAGKAELSWRLLSEQGFKADPLYDALMEAMLTRSKVKLPPLKEPRPFDLALLRAADQPTPAELAALRAPPIWWAVADAPLTEMPTRLALAERLQAMGVWSAEQRAKVMAEVDLPAELLESPLSKAEADAGPRGRAVLRRALERQQTPLARAQVIDKALTLAATNNVYAMEARFYAPAIETIEPNVELGWFAPAAARALIVAGRFESARGWLRVVEAPRDDATRAVADRLFVLARLAAGEAIEPWRGERLDAWIARTKDKPEEAARLGRVLALMSAVGEPVDGRVWRDLVADGDRRPVAMPGPALLPALAEAADKGRIGEGLALAALALGETRLADLPPPVLAPVVAALDRLGFIDDARALAVEAAIAAGL
jgi:hypothetical protein